MSKLWPLIRQELSLRLRGSAGPAALGLFLLAGLFSPFALGTDSALLAAAAPGLLWVFAALSALLGLEGLFQEDLQEGRFGILRLSGLPLWAILVVMMFIYWLVSCVPVVLAAYPVGLMLGADSATIHSLALSLFLGTPALAFIGASLAAICAGLQRGTGLVIFLALPFFAPALIFGARAATGGDNALASFLFLAAFSLQAMALCPVLAAAAIRQNMD